MAIDCYSTNCRFGNNLSKCSCTTILHKLWLQFIMFKQTFVYDYLLGHARFTDIKVTFRLSSSYTGETLSSSMVSNVSLIQCSHLRRAKSNRQTMKYICFDICFTEFGTALTTILPILFQYCYKYCYSDSRNLWAVMKSGGLAL